MKRYHDIPAWCVADAEHAFMRANTAAGLLDEPTDPVLCIANAILEAHEAAIDTVSMWVSDHHGKAIGEAISDHFLPLPSPTASINNPKG